MSILRFLSSVGIFWHIWFLVHILCFSNILIVFFLFHIVGVKETKFEILGFSMDIYVNALTNSWRIFGSDEIHN